MGPGARRQRARHLPDDASGREGDDRRRATRSDHQFLVRSEQARLGRAAAYASSRAATEAFSRVAAIELAQYDILVTCVSPGLIDTQPKPLPSRMAEALGRRIPALPMARAGEPEEVGQVVMFLASEAASYMTGTIVEVDGGAGIGGRFEGSGRR